MVWYAENNQKKPVEGNSAHRPICVPTSAGFFIGDIGMKTTEAQRRASVKWCETNKEKRRKRAKIRYYKKREQLLREYKERMNIPEFRAYRRQVGRKSHQRLRLEIFDHYGGRKCKDCGEKDLIVLTVDHIDGNGCKQRRQIGIGGGGSFYRWLKRNNYPDGYEIVCMNCNWRRRIGRLNSNILNNLKRV